MALNWELITVNNNNMSMCWFFLPEIIIIVLDSALTQFHQILTSLCNPKLKLDFVTIPDDEDFQGTADALRHIKDKIEVCALISVWQV